MQATGESGDVRGHFRILSTIIYKENTKTGIKIVLGIKEEFNGTNYK